MSPGRIYPITRYWIRRSSTWRGRQGTIGYGRIFCMRCRGHYFVNRYEGSPSCPAGHVARSADASPR